MDHVPAAQPSFWDRFRFFLERFLRMQAIGASMFYNENSSSVPVGRPLAESEKIESKLIHLESAAVHLWWGEPVSRWTNDPYLERLRRATPELRAQALAKYGFTEADYEKWLVRYADTAPSAVT